MDRPGPCRWTCWSCGPWTAHTANAQAEEHALLGSCWRGENFVFTGVKGGPIRPDRIYDEFKALRDENLPEIALHGLRKSFVTAARVAEARSDAVADIVGHTSDRTTKDIYQRPDPRVVATATTKVNRLLLGDVDSGHPQTALDHGPALLESIRPAELEGSGRGVDTSSPPPWAPTTVKRTRRHPSGSSPVSFVR